MRNTYKLIIGAIIGVFVSYLFTLTIKPIERKASKVKLSYTQIHKNKKDLEKEVLTRKITDSVHLYMLKCLKNDVISLDQAKKEYQNSMDEYLRESRLSDIQMKAEFKGMKEAFQMLSIVMSEYDCVGNDSTANYAGIE